MKAKILDTYDTSRQINTSIHDSNTLGLEVVLMQDVFVDFFSFEEKATERTRSNLRSH